MLLDYLEIQGEGVSAWMLLIGVSTLPGMVECRPLRPKEDVRIRFVQRAQAGLDAVDTKARGREN